MQEDYLKSYHKDELTAILRSTDNSKHFSINVNFVVLYETYQDLGLELLNSPEDSLEKWDQAAIKAQLSLLKEIEDEVTIKSNVHCRVYHLATCSQFYGRAFPGNKDVGKLVQLSGTVMRISAPKLLEYRRDYICTKCKSPLTVKAEYDRKYIIKEPKRCPGCSGKNFVNFGELSGECCKDYQEMKIQESFKEVGMGALHNVMLVTLEDDLVDTCKPGDNVTICGIVKRRWGEFDKGHKINIDVVLKANYLHVNNKSFTASSTPETLKMFDSFWKNHSEDPLQGRNIILKSICPMLYGLCLVKLALAIVIAGGSQVEENSTGVCTRSESHLLLVGDPGTGKSQLLQFASKIVPRSVLTTGVGSTSAGLTVTAVMEQGEWHLEAGALVLSDGGICCIDEFNSMKEHDRTSIHEAMEQQTISIAKASLVCKLNTRCSIIAACNPKGNIDPSEPLSMNVAIPSPLLSRFDIVLVLRDIVNENRDKIFADYILENLTGTQSKFKKDALWNCDLLQSYFVTIKNLQPKLTNEAEMVLNAYYQRQRRIENRNKARSTVRLLESLVRLSQGHSKLMYRESVELIDAIYAVILIDSAVPPEEAILSLNVNTVIFPEQPGLEYRKMLKVVLAKLDLEEMLDKELAALNDVRVRVESRFFGSKQGFEDENEVNKKRFKCNETNIDVIIDNVFHDTESDNNTEFDCNSTTRLETSESSVNNENPSFNGTEAVNSTMFDLNINTNSPEFGSKQSDVNSEKNDINVNINNNFEDKNQPGPSSKCDKLNKLNKYKFVLKPDCEKAKKEKQGTTNECKQSKEICKERKKECEEVKKDLETFKFIPGINDDLNIDLNFDWDNYEDKNLKKKSENKNKQGVVSNDLFESQEDIDFDV